MAEPRAVDGFRIDNDTLAYLQDRADALHNGDLGKCLTQVLLEARLRHERHVAAGGTGHDDPDDPWDALNAEKVDHFIERDAERNRRRRQ